MSYQWEPEQVIEPPTALRIIQEQFPRLLAKHIRLLGAGWDNTAFILNDEMIFRFPRRKIALPLLEAEWCVLPKISDKLSLPIPVPQWKGVPGPDFPWPFIGYRMLPGFTACHAQISEKQRSLLAEPIARFLSLLHGIPLSDISGCRFEERHLGRVEGSSMIIKIQKNLEEMELIGFDYRKKIESLIERSHPLRVPKASHLVHGDFYVRHLLVDEEHRLTGVIDWGDVHIGDPAIDLAAAHSFLPLDAHAVFRRAYGNVSEETWNLARLRAILSSTYILLFGHHAKDPDLVREGIRSLNVMV